jgi:hypothetical protein
MAFRKYKFGPVFDGENENNSPSNPSIVEPTIVEEKVPEIGNTDNIPKINNEGEVSDLVRVIDNTNSLNKENNNTGNEVLETKEEIKQEELKPELERNSDGEIINFKSPEITTIDEKIDLPIEINSEKSKKPILKKVEEKVTEATGWKPDESVSLGVFSFKNKSERTVFLAFIIPPLVISIISMIHVVSFFELSNTSWLSWALAAAFEFASISALFALTALTKIKKNTIWILFFAIVVMQVIGNMYHSYIHMEPANPDLLKLLSIIGADADALPWTLRILGFLQGGVLPIVSLTFIKALTEYLHVNRENK